MGLLLLVCFGPANIALSIQFWRSPGLTMKMWTDTDKYTRTLGNIERKIQDGFTILAVYTEKRNGTRNDWKFIRLGKPLYNYLPKTTKTGVRALEDIYPGKRQRRSIFGKIQKFVSDVRQRRAILGEMREFTNNIDVTNWVANKISYVERLKFDEIFDHCTEIGSDLEPDGSDLSNFDRFQITKENRTGNIICLKRGTQTMAFVRYNDTDFRVIASCGVSPRCRMGPTTQEQWAKAINTTKVNWRYVFWATCPPQVTSEKDCPDEKHTDFVIDKLALKPFSSRSRCDESLTRIVVNGSDVNCHQSAGDLKVTERTLTTEEAGTAGEVLDLEKPEEQLQHDEPLKSQPTELTASGEIYLKEPSRTTREAGEENEIGEVQENLEIEKPVIGTRLKSFANQEN